MSRIVTNQVYYSIAGRDIEQEMVPMMQDQQVGCLVWSPLSGGYMAGKYTPGDGVVPDAGRRAKFDFPPVDKEKGYAILDVLAPIAKAHGVSVAQAALAWILANDAVTSVIIGAKRVDQLSDNIAATTVALSADELAALDKASALPSEYPGWMFERQGEYRRKQMAAAVQRHQEST